MNIDELYAALKKRTIGKSRFFKRELLVVEAPVFEEYRRYFTEVADIMNGKPNYRTPGKFKHIHAIQTGPLVELHLDYGNTRYILGAVVHFFRDEIQYFLWHLVTWTRPYAIDPKSVPEKYRDALRAR